MNIHGFNIKLSYESSLWTASLKMAAERYLSRRIPDLRVGNNIDEIDKKLIPASIHPWLHAWKTWFVVLVWIFAFLWDMNVPSVSYASARSQYQKLYSFEASDAKSDVRLLDACLPLIWFGTTSEIFLIQTICKLRKQRERERERERD